MNIKEQALEHISGLGDTSQAIERAIELVKQLVDPSEVEWMKQALNLTSLRVSLLEEEKEKVGKKVDELLILVRNLTSQK